MGLSLTRRDLAVRAGPGGRVDLGLAVRGPVDLGPVDLAVRGLDQAPGDLVDPAALVDRVVRHPVDPADIRHRVDLAGLVLPDPADRVDRVVPDRVDLEAPAGLADRLHLAGLADIRDLVGLVDRLDLADRVDLGMSRAGLVDRLDPADRVDLGMSPADRVDLGMSPADRVNLGMSQADQAGLVDRARPAGLVIRVDPRRRRTRLGVRSTGVAPSGAVPGMCHTASARLATARRLRRHNADGAGMVGLRPKRRRLGGTDRRPRVAGLVLRLPVVGTARGMVRRAT
jgi:hypothetical protein